MKITATNRRAVYRSADSRCEVPAPPETGIWRCHAKKADGPGEQVQHITEIRRVIIDPKNDVDPPVHQGEVSRQVVEPGVIRSVIMPAEQERDGLHWGTDEPDAVARARFDKMRRN